MDEIANFDAERAAPGALDMRRSRGGEVAVLLAGAAFVAAAAWTANAYPGAGATALAGMIGGGAAVLVGLLLALRPGRLVISGDGIHVSSLLGGQAAAWEEVMAIGRRSDAGWLSGATRGGVRIALMEAAPIDLPPGWPMSPDDMVEILANARAEFSQLAPPEAAAEPVAPPDEPAPQAASIVESA